MPASTRFVLPLLVLLSGFCGISYEILYAKLLGNLLGSQFTINATVLLTFLLGIGLGTLYAHHLGRYLWWIEAGIGGYAAMMSLLYDGIARVLYSSLPVLGTNLYAAATTAFFLLLAPTFLIGCSVPLFASYLTSLRWTHVFSITYAVYNVGAALTALAIEFVLVRSVGIRSSTLILAGLNGVVALGILILSRTTPLIPEPPAGRLRFPRRVLVALAMASVGSAIFQLLMMKVAEFVFGPYHETFSLVLATVLLGLALGSFAAGRIGLTFSGALILSLIGLGLILGLLPQVIYAYAALYADTVGNYPLLVAVKFGVVFVLMGLPAIGFGATIPTLLRAYRDVARESGQLLFFSSVANALGFLLMAFVLHRYLDYGPILLAVAALTAAAVLLHSGPRRAASVVSVGLVAAAAGAYGLGWDETLLYRGHTNFHALMQPSRGRVTTKERFKGPQDVFAITVQDGIPYFFINGYISIPLHNATENIVAALSAMISPRLDDALVLGVGSGSTAASVSLLFERTDAVEINRVVLDHLHLMKPYNFDIENLPDLRLHHDDGIHFLRSTPRKYSLILNTVTTPLYFSSSKLYTRELFDLVVDRLTPDGVYMTWIDVEIGDRGLNIILESLGRSFRECWIGAIEEDYFLLGCSKTSIRIRNLDGVVANDVLSKYLADDFGLPIRALPYNFISTDALGLQGPEEVPVNTLDFPVLEFEMAQLQKDRLTEFHRRLDQRLDLRALEDEVGKAIPWSPAELAVNTDLYLAPGSRLSNLLWGRVTREHGVTEGEYTRAAAALAESLGSSEAVFRFGQRLLFCKRYEAASRILSRVLESDPAASRIHFLLAEAHRGAGREDLALEHYLREWNRSRFRDVPYRVGKTLIRLERYAEALEWLDTAAEVDGFRGDAEKEHYYRGLAHEGLERLEQAARCFEQALAAEPDSRRARRALDRVRISMDSGAGSSE